MKERRKRNRNKGTFYEEMLTTSTSSLCNDKEFLTKTCMALHTAKWPLAGPALYGVQGLIPSTATKDKHDLSK